MPVVEHEQYVEAARGQQGLLQRHGRAGELARQHAVSDACPEALFGGSPRRGTGASGIRKAIDLGELNYPSRAEITT